MKMCIRDRYRHASLYKAFLLFGTSFFSDRKIKHLLGNINHRIEGVRTHFSIFKPVSYTHLDVYKRQIENHAPGEINFLPCILFH